MQINQIGLIRDSYGSLRRLPTFLRLRRTVSPKGGHGFLAPTQACPPLGENVPKGQKGEKGLWKETRAPVKMSEEPQIVQAKVPAEVEMDKSGYFVVIPQAEKDVITVEHYSYDNRLQRTIKGKKAKSIYQTIIENGWLTQLSHAAYLGKELAKAELSIKLGIKYVQDEV